MSRDCGLNIASELSSVHNLSMLKISESNVRGFLKSLRSVLTSVLEDHNIPDAIAFS
jgi:Asp-tRNA(Asn)/Glu-tRNA(Gln) amidotransferase C subunit